MTGPGEKRALVTGGSDGLGRALTDALLADGWDVISVDIRPCAGDNHPCLEQIECDLSDRDSVDALLKRLDEEDGFDLVILNAAVNATGKFKDIPLNIHQKLLRLNAETPMVMAARLPAMGKLRHNARLVFISSLSHFTGYPGAASYAASKDAMAIYAKSIRKPYSKMGVRVCCVFPGPLRTGHAERHAPKNARAEKRMAPETAAFEILKGVSRGTPVIIPGGGARMFALLGRLAPWASDRAMRKIIHEKLDRDVF